MSASSTTASSTLLRPKGAVLIVAALVCAYGTYYLWNTVEPDLEPSDTTANTLHRSNAVHRRRRRTNTGNADVEPTSSLHEIAAESAEEGANLNIAPRALTDGETVIDDTGFADEYNWNNPYPYERNGQNIVQLLFRVSEDATRRNAYVHRGCECNSCGAVPIRGIRYHCANCADYDLCEGCESQGLHIKTHIFYKIRVPAPAFGPILSMPVAYSGDPDTVEMKVLSKELTTRLSRETGFERPELDAYWEQWTFMANTEWRDDPDEIGLAMDRKTFEHCLVPSGGYRQPAPSLIFDRMFAFYDTNHDDLISFPEFLHGIAYRKKKEKWSKIFQGYDVDGDGYVDRKDFLRMFRSYYALYRQMHRDMLGGMQEQQMITSQAHQLVSGRQPLSGVFAAESRFPRGVDIRAGEGKSVQPSGELEISDGKGTIEDSGNDTASREEVYRRNNTPSGYWNRERSASAYWETVLNPPQNMTQLERTVRQIAEAGDATMDVLQNGSIFEVTRSVNDNDNSSDSYDSSTDSISDPEHDHTWMPDDIELTDEDAEAVEGPGIRLIDVRRTNRRAVIAHALARERIERELRDRWKRRQFYTDEEEGAPAPKNWKEEEDILVTATTGESSKSNSRPSMHSRSSSKVRFAEDMDDFDTRSNPSTSSRSVPERWGGYEIPDAERDAGKEILFQVTQQAFNELLDPLFKDLEDSAVRAAERKAEIEKHRDLFTRPEFHTWALAELTKAKAEMRNEKKEASSPRPLTDDLTRPVWPELNVVDIPDLRQRPLEELLEATGYEIAESPRRNSAVSPGEDSPRDASEQARSNNSLNGQVGRGVLGPLSQSPVSPSEVERSVLEHVTSNDETPENTTEIELEDVALISDSAEVQVFRDPTMPQFKPNANPLNDTTIEEAEQESSSQRTQPDEPASSQPESSKTNAPEQAKGPSRATLWLLWKSDQDVKESEKRGGWGRLNFEEFEERVKTFVKEGKGNQMDYLGSWIEFCIP